MSDELTDGLGTVRVRADAAIRGTTTSSATRQVIIPASCRQSSVVRPFKVKLHSQGLLHPSSSAHAA